MKLYFSILLLFILLLVAFIFGTQNKQIVELNFLIARADITVAMAVSIFTAIGVAIGIMLALVFSLQRKLARRKKHRSS
ncbi:lipopolysaccharide assembly protein LapA domain-containing protein [Thalassotalea maritima]|uniref:lipopolysaccharide assembly protein LapA domain-containing protein n=1 Tax=Thalassotalea maritima TaxID=3242416 RepID=UPI0035289B56